MARQVTQFGECEIAATNVIQSIALHKKGVFFNRLWIYPGLRQSTGKLSTNSADVYIGERGDGPDTTPDLLAPNDLPIKIELPEGENKRLEDVLIQGTQGDGIWFKYWTALFVLVLMLASFPASGQERGIRRATQAEVNAGIVDNAYVTPKTLQASVGGNAGIPKELGFGTNTHLFNLKLGGTNVQAYKLTAVDPGGLVKSINTVVIDPLWFGVTNYKATAFNDSSLANLPASDDEMDAAIDAANAAIATGAKVRFLLPDGIIRITRPLVFTEPDIEIVGQGTVRLAGHDGESLEGGYSIIWQSDPDEHGIILDAADLGKYHLEDFEVFGAGNPTWNRNSANLSDAPIWSPSNGTTNATTFARTGIHIKGRDLKYCGGVTIDRVAVVGFRIGLVNEGNNQKFYRFMAPACDIGIVQTDTNYLSFLTYADMPINLPAYLTLIRTNDRASNSQLQPGGTMGMGLPDQNTYINPFFGSRKGGLGLFINRGNGTTIIDSTGINGPKCYAWLSSGMGLSVIGGNDEPLSYMGTNWIYQTRGNSTVFARGWNIQGAATSGTNAYGSYMTNAAFIGSPDYNVEDVDFGGYFTISGLTDYPGTFTSPFLVSSPGQSDGRVRANWRADTQFRGRIGSMMFPVVGNNNVPAVLQPGHHSTFWFTNQFFNRPDLLPYGQVLVKKGSGGVQDQLFVLLDPDGGAVTDPADVRLFQVATGDAHDPFSLVDNGNAFSNRFTFAGLKVTDLRSHSGIYSNAVVTTNGLLSIGPMTNTITVGVSPDVYAHKIGNFQNGTAEVYPFAYWAGAGSGYHGGYKLRLRAQVNTTSPFAGDLYLDSSAAAGQVRFDGNTGSAYLNGWLRTGNRTATPTGAEIGANNAIWWVSNAVPHVSYTTDGSAVTTTRLIP